MKHRCQCAQATSILEARSTIVLPDFPVLSLLTANRTHWNQIARAFHAQFLFVYECYLIHPGRNNSLRPSPLSPSISTFVVPAVFLEPPAEQTRVVIILASVLPIRLHGLIDEQSGQTSILFTQLHSRLSSGSTHRRWYCYRNHRR